jgi:hypothetical protein
MACTLQWRKTPQASVLNFLVRGWQHADVDGLEFTKAGLS